MEKVSDALIASTFQKVKDVDIFSLKAYMERTRGVETSTQGILMDVFVNLPFFILNLIVGFFLLSYDFLRISVFMNPIDKLFLMLRRSFGIIYLALVIIIILYCIF
ncbi:hypothetical protein BOVMAS12_16880 [Streptococcus uberis]